MSRQYCATEAAPVVRNRYGYEQRAPAGSWVICDDSGDPIRVHNGFAFFSSKEQAAWTVELMRISHQEGAEGAQLRLREALGLTE